MSHKKNLFTPLSIKEITFKNRIWLSPMCQYSSKDGYPNDWHFVHLASRALGGVGLVMVEATAVTPEGRISPHDNGIWSDEHIPHYEKISSFIKNHGSVSGIQIAHAGRKASVTAPWFGGTLLSQSQGGWQPIAPSAIPFIPEEHPPQEMNQEDIESIIIAFEKAAERCLAAGFQVLELHMAHGYLIHEFLSPISNQRRDEYGGNIKNRMKFPLLIAQKVRNIWPQHLPLFVRISCTDWAHGPDELNQVHQRNQYKDDSWHLDSAILLCRELKSIGVDLIDCSSGGLLPHANIPVGPGYQVPFAEMIRNEVPIMTSAVGMITEAHHAESILLQQQADAVFMGRELLRNPYWPIQAASALGVKIEHPQQYARAHRE